MKFFLFSIVCLYSLAGIAQIKNDSGQISVSDIPRTIENMSMPFFLSEIKDTVGIMVLTDTTPTHSDYSYLGGIRDIKWRADMKNYYLKGQRYRKSGSILQFNTSVGLEKVNHLPKLQQTYAQGRTNGNSLQWNGPETQEIFSWGPAINSLEFDGSNYIYDTNGKLVPSGNGDGKSALAYDPSHFFRTGVTLKNSIDLKTPFLEEGILAFNLGQNIRTSPIPNANMEVYNASIRADKFRLNKDEDNRLYANTYVAYSYAEGKLLSRGSNLSNLIASVLTTPPTFDNSNGLSGSEAVKNNSSWLLPNGGMRSYASNFTDNPYALVNELPDKENNQHLLASIESSYREKATAGFIAKASIRYDQQWDDIINGTAKNSSAYLFQRYSKRKEQQSDVILSVMPEYIIRYNSSKDLRFILNYRFNHQSNHIFRSDAFTPFSNPVSSDKNLSRNIQELSYGAKFTNDFLFAEGGNLHYFSNTSGSGKFTNLFPYIGAKLKISELLKEHCYKYYTNYYTSNTYNLFGSVSRSIKEASLIYRNPAILSTEYSAETFNKYYEYTDILFDNNLKPETFLKTEIGFQSYLMRNKLNLEITYFNNATSGFIVPVMQEASLPKLINAGKVRNTGGTFSASYSNWWYHTNIYWNISLNLSKAKNKVISSPATSDYLPLSGFSDIATVFATGKPLGAIYGSTYLRNNNGEILIGNDGFPIADRTMKMIGDPTPDFTASLYPFIQWNHFNLSLNIEYQNGGDIWNGTQAVLNYQGVSKETGELRGTTNYIFSGINQTTGQPNTKSIDFYNASLPIEQNRWVRYGYTGIGEEYIEDGTFLRLSDISISYSLFRTSRKKGTIKNAMFTLTGLNLFLFTPNTSVDPTSSLFNYSTGKGLNLFNLPVTKSYLFSIKIDI